MGLAPGPGSYKSVLDIEELKVSSVRPSSFFVSNVPRDKEQAQNFQKRMKTNPTPTATVTSAIQDIIDMEDDDSTGPGPGEYYNGNQSTFHTKK